MMTICYLSVVTITCIFGCGAAQTTATPPEADFKLLHLQFVTSGDSYLSSSKSNRIVLAYTLSLKSSTAPGPIHPGYVPNHPKYDYHDREFWYVKSPREALDRANEELGSSERPWERVILENRICYLVPMNREIRTEFFFVLTKAIQRFRPYNAYKLDQTSLTTKWPEADLGCLYIQYVFRRIPPIYESVTTLTLSLKSSTLYTHHSTFYKIYDVAYWVVKNPERVLDEVVAELEILQYQHRVNIDSIDGRKFYTLYTSDADLFYSAIMDATKEFRHSKIIIIDPLLSESFQQRANQN